jgi:hypothetical protein
MVRIHGKYSRPSFSPTGERALLLCLQWQRFMGARVAKPGQRRKIQVWFEFSRRKSRAWVAKPGQRRRLQGPVSKEFGGSNPFPRISLLLPFTYAIAG